MLKFQEVAEKTATMRSSAVAERPRDASFHWIVRSVTQGHSKSYEMVPFESLGTVLYSFQSNYGHILYYFPDKARYWSKITILHTPLHSTPPLGVPVGILPQLQWCGYTRWWKFDDTFSSFNTIPACDGRTDRQTDILRQQILVVCFMHSIAR